MSLYVSIVGGGDDWFKHCPFSQGLQRRGSSCLPHPTMSLYGSLSFGLDFKPHHTILGMVSVRDTFPA